MAGIDVDRFAGMDFETALRYFANTVTRVCKLHCNNEEDAKDCFQNTFIKLFQCREIFLTEAHMKAWLITVAIHECADIFRQSWKKHIQLHENMNSVLLQKEELRQLVIEESDDTLEMVLILPIKYRRVLYLYYYEQYNIQEIAQMLSASENTVKTHMARGRKKLYNQLSNTQNNDWKMVKLKEELL